MSTRRLSLGFGLAFVALFGAFAWITSVALRLETAEFEARQQATLDENVRLALWRMDSALLPVIARENARGSAAEAPSGMVRRTFELDADGELGPLRGAELLALLPVEAQAAPIPDAGVLTEWDLRSASLEGCAQAATPTGLALTPLWVRGELVLARRTGPRSVQGTWLDWPQLQRFLLSTVIDLLPNAQLETADLKDQRERRLAALPLRLVPGALAESPRVERSSVRMVLGVAWAALVLATLAVVALLAGTLKLAERRATFVSAVTHELRTPLTTLQTYAEMLLSGKLTDAADRQHYLETLHREAVRLGHLVENVLAYSGVERGRTAKTEPLSLATVLERNRERFTERLARAGLSLELDVDSTLRVHGATGPIEQVLFNLIDNAAKYGAGKVSVTAREAGPTIELRVRDEGRGVSADVRARLFEPFSKSAERAAGNVPGVGLGLALSRSLARAMGGDLRLDSGSAGACFVLSLRRAEPR